MGVPPIFSIPAGRTNLRNDLGLNVCSVPRTLRGRARFPRATCQRARWQRWSRGGERSDRRCRRPRRFSRAGGLWEKQGVQQTVEMRVTAKQIRTLLSYCPIDDRIGGRRSVCVVVPANRTSRLAHHPAREKVLCNGVPSPRSLRARHQPRHDSDGVWRHSPHLPS